MAARHFRALERVDRWVRNIGPGQLFWTLIGVDLLIIAALLLTAFVPREARLSIDARTQLVDLVVAKHHGFDGWGTVEPTSTGPLANGARCDAPSLEMPPQLSGPLTMRAKSNDDGGLTIAFTDAAPGSLGTLLCGGEEYPVGKYLVLTWNAERARRLALPFAGELTVGSYFSDQSEPRILLGGTIVAQASSAPFRDARVSSETKLYPGDFVRLAGGATGTAGSSHGILRVVDGAIDVTAHAMASEAEVTHIGQQETGPESIAPSFFAKLQAQSQWGLLLVMVGIILHMLSVLRDYLFERARVEPGSFDRGGS